MVQKQPKKIRYYQGETFACALFMLNVTYAKLVPMKVIVKIQ